MVGEEAPTLKEETGQADQKPLYVWRGVGRNMLAVVGRAECSRSIGLPISRIKSDVGSEPWWQR